MGSHKGYDVGAGEVSRPRIGARRRRVVVVGADDARHERRFSKGQDLKIAREGFGEELGQKLRRDVTDATLTTDLVGQRVDDGVGDGLRVGDGLGVGSGTYWWAEKPQR
jgi:hypothetical protein